MKNDTEIDEQVPLQLTMDTICNSWDIFSQIYSNEETVVLRIESADSAGVQLLTSMVVSRKKAGLETQVETANDEIAELLQSLGLAPLLL